MLKVRIYLVVLNILRTFASETENNLCDNFKTKYNYGKSE
jgi:hypothetical protein